MAEYDIPDYCLHLLIQFKAECTGNIKSVTFNDDNTITIERNDISHLENNNRVNTRETKIDKLIESFKILKLREMELSSNQLIISQIETIPSIEFGDNINSVYYGIAEWKKREFKLMKLKEKITITKWINFLNLNQAYEALNNIVNQELSEDESITELTYNDKIDCGIPLGQNESEKNKRGWIAAQMRSMLNIDKRREVRIWTALQNINQLLSNGTISREMLYNLKESPDTFIKMNKNDFNYFLNSVFRIYKI
ncbi:39316_t:CDS:2 [Gigaspora margarita]|uniref:39316_t:CDS:1 n=1 Tax=Gigaspora margarita TaxID=4874 RepID=A0ABN7V8T1_GIGMA|nr:39316_t:CDS:2 [Gigaspora margarita]